MVGLLKFRHHQVKKVVIKTWCGWCPLVARGVRGESLELWGTSECVGVYGCWRAVMREKYGLNSSCCMSA